MKPPTEIPNPEWIGTIVGLAGIIIGIYLALSLRPRPRLAAQINTLDLVGPNAVLPEGIEFLFRGHKVPKVTLSRIAFWNIGNTTIKGDQIVSSDPLRIVLGENASVLETTVLVRTRTVNDFACLNRPTAEGEVECRFDFLDPNDGVLIQIIHTGTNKLEVTGTLRGVPKGVLRVPPPQKEKPKESRALSRFLAKLIGLASGFAGLLAIVGALRVGDWGLTVAGALLMTVGVLLLVSIGRIPPSGLNPEITSNEPRQRRLSSLMQRR